MDPDSGQTKLLIGIVKGYLQKLGLEYSPTALDTTFFNECCEEMLLRNWPDETIASLRPCLPGGVIMACTAYNHLSNQSTRILIALYTAILIYLDDVAGDIPEELQTFVEVFACNGKHRHDVLASFADIIREFPQHFGEFSAIVLTSSLNFISSLVLENKIPQLLVSHWNQKISFPDCDLKVSTECGRQSIYSISDFREDPFWGFRSVRRFRICT